MQKLSGKSGRIKIGSAITITGAVCTDGVVAVTAVNTLSVGMFVLISGVVGMTDLNNSGKGHLVTVASGSGFSVVLATAQTYTSGGTAKRIIPITEYNLNINGEVGDAVDSESGEWKERLAGKFKDWDFDYNGIDYSGAAMPPVNEELAVELDIDANNYYSGNAIFDNAKIGVKIEGAQNVSISGTAKGNGALTKTAA